MSVTVAAALKKIAVAILTDKDTLKKVCTFIASVFALLFMPLAAILALFQGDIEFTPEMLEEIAADIDPEELEKLTKVQETVDSIDLAMDEAGMSERAEEAELLYMLALYDCSDEEDFAQRLTDCFEEDQSDYDLIDNVNEEFGTDIDPAEFVMVMSGIRKSTINPYIFQDPYTKNNIDLAAFAKEAYSDDWGYVWGTYGTVLTQKGFESLCEADPTHVGKYEEFIQENWIGRRTADCVGLIKAYMWYNPDIQDIQYGYNSYEDCGANAMYKASTESGPIEEMPDIPGLGVWKHGHVGVYVGDGIIVQAMGTKYGLVKTYVEYSTFTNWFKIPGIIYPDA